MSNTVWLGVPTMNAGVLYQNAAKLKVELGARTPRTRHIVVPKNVNLGACFVAALVSVDTVELGRCQHNPLCDGAVGILGFALSEKRDRSLHVVSTVQEACSTVQAHRQLSTSHTRHTS